MMKDFCSIGSTWSQQGWFKWAIPSVIGLLLLTLVTRCNPIENDLGAKTQSLLDAQGMSWAKTALDGRDVIVTGEAPSGEARKRAITLTQSVKGVRTVGDEMTLKQWFSSQLTLKQKGDIMVLSGTMPDQASIDATVSQAHSLYGDTHVSNQLEISDSASAPAWLAGTTGLMETLQSTRNLTMSVSDEKVEITGDVETEAEKVTLLAEAYASYGDVFSESIDVVKTRPTADELALIAAAKLAEEARIVEEIRIATEAKVARLAEAARIAAEVKAARLAEEARIAAAAEATRLAEEARIVAEAEAARLAEEARIAAEATRLAAEKKAALLETLATCQADFEQVVSANPTFFKQDSSVIRGESYHALGLLAQKVNYCSEVLHIEKRSIQVSAHAGKGETSPISALMSQQRTQAVIAYLEVISGAHHGLLRQSRAKTVENHAGHSQLHFNISE